MSTTASISTQNLTSQASAAAARGSLLRRALSTSAGASATIARLSLAIVMFPHGAQKLLGWFGGYGFAGTFGFLTKSGLPAPIAVAVILIEFSAPLLLLAGLGTRFAALGIGAIMLGAIATVHASQGFFMNWAGTQSGEGFEYHLLALGLVGALLVQGGGRFSLDRRLASRIPEPHAD